jgi:hypothetical protein
MDDYITFMMLQQLVNPSSQSNKYEMDSSEIKTKSKYQDDIEKTKQEVLNLLQN